MEIRKTTITIRELCAGYVNDMAESCVSVLNFSVPLSMMPSRQMR